MAVAWFSLLAVPGVVAGFIHPACAVAQFALLEVWCGGCEWWEELDDVGDGDAVVVAAGVDDGGAHLG